MIGRRRAAIVHVERAKLEELMTYVQELLRDAEQESEGVKSSSPAHVVSLKEAASLLSRDRTTVKKWAAEADALVPDGGRWLVDLDKLRAHFPHRIPTFPNRP